MLYLNVRSYELYLLSLVDFMPKVEVWQMAIICQYAISFYPSIEYFATYGRIKYRTTQNFDGGKY